MDFYLQLNGVNTSMHKPLSLQLLYNHNYEQNNVIHHRPVMTNV